MTQLCRVGISGSYGGLNLGDEAILQVIVRELRRSLPVEITVFSRNPEDTLRRHDVERALPVRDLSRQEVAPEVKRLDLLILGGGGIIFDEEARIYLREVEIAHEAGVPVMVYAISAGPLKDPDVQKVVRHTLGRVAALTVRDREAQRVLEEAGVKREITVTADPALLLAPEELPEEALMTEGLDSSRRLVGMSVREPGVAAPNISEEHYHALLANAADYIIERVDADLVFVPMEPDVLDTQQSHAVIAQMANAPRARVLKGRYTSGQILALVKHFSFVVGMRLHLLIFSAIQRVPFVALPYAGKVSGFLETLEMKAGPMDEMSIGRLIAHVDRSWDLQEDLRARIDRNMPAVQERARENNRIAVDLLRSGAKGAS
jgi:polysaccharide pyruvyl transferase CsaB